MSPCTTGCGSVVAAQDALSRHALRQLPQRAVADRLAQRPLRRDPRAVARRRAVRPRDGTRLPAAASRPAARAAPRRPCTCCPCRFRRRRQAHRRRVPGTSRARRWRATCAGSSRRAASRSPTRSTAGRARCATATSPCSRSRRGISSCFPTARCRRHSVRVARAARSFCKTRCIGSSCSACARLADPRRWRRRGGAAPPAVLRARSRPTSARARGAGGAAMPRTMSARASARPAS